MRDLSWPHEDWDSTMKRIRRSPDQAIRTRKTAEQLINQDKTITGVSRFIEVAQPTHITAGDSRAVESTPRKL